MHGLLIQHRPNPSPINGINRSQCSIYVHIPELCAGSRMLSKNLHCITKLPSQSQITRKKINQFNLCSGFALLWLQWGLENGFSDSCLQMIKQLYSQTRLNANAQIQVLNEIGVMQTEGPGTFFFSKGHFYSSCWPWDINTKNAKSLSWRDCQLEQL